MKAGIAVKIVTGDTPGTAKEIGRQINLWTDSESIAVFCLLCQPWRRRYSAEVSLYDCRKGVYEDMAETE